MKHVLASVFAIFTSPVWAAPIPVKSGEHAEFTRIVVYLTNDQEWKLSEADGFTTFNVSNWSEGFDTKEVFDRINTRRLRSLTATKDNLVLSLNCECAVTAIELAQGFVSLDIREKATLRPIARPVELEKKDTNGVTSAPEPPEEVVVRLDWPVVFEDEFDDPTLGRILKEPTLSPVSDFESGLGREIARSATLNYLQPNGSELPAKNQSNSRSREELLSELGQRANFSNAGSSEFKPKPGPELNCPPQELFSISDWGGSADFSDQLASLRDGLYSEFDTTNIKAARQLMRFYAHYGLVEELLDVSATFPNTSDFDRLQTLGKIVGGSDYNEKPVLEHFHCGGEAGFWSFVSGDKPDDVTQAQVEELVSVYQRLPMILRDATSDRLVGLFDQFGFGVASGVIRSTVYRSEKKTLEETAQQTFTSDLDSMAQNELLVLVDKNDENSAKALAVFMENAILSGTQVPVDMVELAGAYIHQLSGQEIASRLLSSQILALAVGGDDSQALDLLLAKDGEYSKPEKTKSNLAEIVLEAAQPLNISQLVLRLKESEMLMQVEESTRIAMAKFLEDQGQPQLANLVLDEIEISPTLNAIQARILATEGRQSDAVDLLGDGSIVGIGPRMSEVFLMQDPQQAWSLRDDLDGVAAEEVAWISQNWESVPNESPRKGASQLISESLTVTPNSEKPIADAQDAFSKSQETRKVLDELLNNN